MLFEDIVHGEIFHVGQKDWRKDAARFPLINELLVRNMENNESMQFAMTRAAMDVSMGLIVAALKVDPGFPEAMLLLKTASGYLLTVEGCPAQTRQKDFELSKIGTPDSSCLLRSRKRL